MNADCASADARRDERAPRGLTGEIARRLWPLDSSKLCARARRRTGLTDFGEAPVEPGLTVLLESLERQAGLRPLGRMLMGIHLRELLETRLRLAEAWKKEPEAESAKIEKPVFIVGMPRSGSTFLHELLGENPEYRAPRVWEVMFPVATSRRRDNDEARRVRQADFCLWWFRRLAPRADAVYPMRAMTPHECVAIHSYTFLSEEFVSTCSIPAYEQFLHSADLTPVYAWQERFLQHLQWGCPGKRWVLKSPDHVYGLESLARVFPDARIIQTHRNPVEVVKSSADLTRVLRGLYGSPGDAEEIRAREARVLAEATERFIGFRDAHPELADRFIDVKYTDLIANPLGTVRQICEQLDSPVTDLMVKRVQEMAAKRSRYRGPRASAQAASGKWVTAAETRRFERYCARFQLSFTKADFTG